jgi:branched-chain amino acid transport system ATP-binding protein
VGKTPHQITALRIGRTFQNIRLFRDLSVLDNVRIAHYAQADYSPLGSVVAHRPLPPRGAAHHRKFPTAAGDFQAGGVGGRNRQNLPYGLQRRLEIARALAIGPELLLLDEPAAGMNPNEIDQLMEFIQWIRQEFKLTILLIEHQMKLVMGICERIKVLDFGETLAEGPPEPFRIIPRCWRRIWARGRWDE